MIGKYKDCIRRNGDWHGKDDRRVDYRYINFKECEGKRIKTEYPGYDKKVHGDYYSKFSQAYRQMMARQTKGSSSSSIGQWIH